MRLMNNLIAIVTAVSCTLLYYCDILIHNNDIKPMVRDCIATYNVMPKLYFVRFVGKSIK